MSSKQKQYWFRPKRFWGWFAFYVPTSRAGWVATLILLATAIILFQAIDVRSHSAADTLLAFAPWVIALLALFDLLCFRCGEYPSWWRKRQASKR